MSLESATDFVTSMMEDPDLLDRVSKATEGKEGTERTTAVVSLGAERGYDFTGEEIDRVKEILDDMDQESADELSANQLEAVSGGALFVHYDQKATQTYQTLSSVLRSMEDAKGTGAAVRSGL